MGSLRHCDGVPDASRGWRRDLAMVPTEGGSRTAPAMAPCRFSPRNLRRNPFGEPPLDELPSLVVAEVDEMVAWMDRPRHAVQLIGECGRGKSARLHAIRAASGDDLPYLYLAEGEPIPPIPDGPALALDEAQRLPRRWRRRLFERLERLALATHVDLTRELERAGWTVWTIEVGGLDRERLASILAARIAWARRGAGPVPVFSDEALDELLRRFADDVRSMFDHLYEVMQRPGDGFVVSAEEVRGGEV